ncbi:MAG: UbiA family prenyltransferase [Methanoregula sp.]|jgi:4-hydroxybenzoate polyprenyltransferase
MPTLRLLNSSTIVAVAGGLRLNIAFLLAGLAIRMPEYCAFALIIYATYTLDRSLDCREDAINRADLCGANGNVGLFASIVAFGISTIILVLDGIYLAPIFPFIVGYIYTRGIHIGSWNLRLKGGIGIKNAVIGITWAGTIALIVARWYPGIAAILVIFLFYFVKLFTTSCINDFKDVSGDLAAGIRTLPAYWGESKTKHILLSANIALHLVMILSVFLGIIRNEWVIILYSLIANSLFLMVYSSSFEKSASWICRKLRNVVIYWESAISLILRAVIPV